VRPFRPRNVGHQPVMRYETKPGEQMQYEVVVKKGMQW
jgi:hypothetical protein